MRFAPAFKRARRERLQVQTPSPARVWVADVGAPDFVTAAGDQSREIAASQHEPDDQAFIDAVFSGWDSGHKL